jgi:ice-binding like protein
MGEPCNDGLFCNGADHCDGAGGCTIHAGDPCTGGAACNTLCNELAANCFNPADSACTDDGKVCTTDTCDGMGTCVHAPLPSGTVCDDADSCSLHDVCDGAGTCAGTRYTANYAVLRWSIGPVPANFNRNARVDSRVCVDTLRLGVDAQINGDAVALKTSVGTVRCKRGETATQRVTQNLVTGGGSVIGLVHCHVGGSVIIGTPASAPFLDECAAATCTATDRRAEFLALGSDATFGKILVKRNSTGTLTLPAMGAATDQIVVDGTDLVVQHASTLTLQGASPSATIIIRLSGKLSIGRESHLILGPGIIPEHLMFIVAGRARVANRATIEGTIFGAKDIKCARNCVVDGTLVGAKAIRVGQDATINTHPFAGW